MKTFALLVGLGLGLLLATVLSFNRKTWTPAIAMATPAPSIPLGQWENPLDKRAHKVGGVHY